MTDDMIYVALFKRKGFFGEEEISAEWYERQPVIPLDRWRKGKDGRLSNIRGVVWKHISVGEFFWVKRAALMSAPVGGDELVSISANFQDYALPFMTGDRLFFEVGALSVDIMPQAT